jgi:signal transduction histidine kinase
MSSGAVPYPSDSDPLALIVVEDSDDDYELVLARLRHAFGPVRTLRVDNRAMLEQALDQGGWSAVISDHRMPGFTSIEALRATRARVPEMPFIIVSGAIGEEIAVSAMQAGANDFVMKDKLGRLGPALAHAIEASRSLVRRREAESALIESEARFRSLAANLPGMVFQIEVDGARLRPAYAGEGARRLFGLTPVDLEANPGAWLARLSPEDVERLRTRFLVATAGVTSFDWNESVPQSNAPAPHWIDQVIVIPADDEAGVPVRYIELTSRARRVGSTRVLWDGIATDITRQKEIELALTRSREELRELGGHLARVREIERAAIARELHDDVGSTLTGVKFQLQWLKGRAADDATLVTKLEQLNGLLDSAITASSRIMHHLRPPILDQGIAAALEWQARSFEQHTGLPCRFAAPAEELALAPAQAIVVFRVCQEALNNVVKHAQASSVDVTLMLDDEGIGLEVRDDGRGIDPSDTMKRGSFGVRGMQERALALGGAVSVAVRDDGPGTSVRLTLPMGGESAEGGARI